MNALAKIEINAKVQNFTVAKRKAQVFHLTKSTTEMNSCLILRGSLRPTSKVLHKDMFFTF